MGGSSKQVFRTRAVAFLATLSFLVALETALAQYQSSYPYAPRPSPTPQLPKRSQHFGGLIGNPYRNDGIPPSGLPIGRNLNSYYGGVSSIGTGNPFVQQHAAKPFSNLHRPQPLITSRQAAQIEVARGLWYD